MGRRGGVDSLQHLGQDPGGAEEREGAAQARRLAGQCGLESLLRDIFIVRVDRVFRMDVIVLHQLGETENGGRVASHG